MRKYNFDKIIDKARNLHQKEKTLRHLKHKHEMEMETKDLQLKMTQSKLKRHEDVEKRRTEGLKKAQKKRKSNATTAKRRSR